MGIVDGEKKEKLVSVLVVWPNTIASK